MDAPVLITGMEPLTEIISTFNHFPDFRPCRIFLGTSCQSKTFSPTRRLRGTNLIRSARSRRISSRCWTWRCVCIASVRISSLERSCLFGVEVTCSAFMKTGFMRSRGLLPRLVPKGVVRLRVTCVFLNVADLRFNWARVICAKVVWYRFEAVSTSADRNFLNNRTPQLDLDRECSVLLEVS